MPNPPVFRGQLDWMSVLDVLGYKNLNSSALPITITCMQCQGTLTVYPDILSGSWVNCSSCGLSGDLLELLMHIWNLDALTALKKFQSRGGHIEEFYFRPSRLNSYTKRLQQRKQYRTYWADITKYPFQDNEHFFRLHEQLAIKPEYDLARWRQQLGKYVGHAPLRLSNDSGYGPHSRYDNSDHSPWSDLVVLPFQSLPGKVTGFYSVGRAARPDTDWLWRDTCDSEGEAGLGFYDALLTHSAKYGDTGFVFQDPYVTLRIQSRWFQGHNSLLPVALAYETADARPRHVFDTLPKRDLVFWAPTPTKEVFAQAARCGARVFIKPLELEDLNRYELWLHKLSNMAKRWDEVLETQMPRMSDPELEKILFSLDLNAEEWRCFLHARNRASRNRIKFLYNKQWPVRKLTLVWRGGGLIDITEKGNCWYANGSLITDAKIRLQQLWVERDEVWARGVIYHGHRKVPFAARERTLTPNPGGRCSYARIITESLARANAGVPVFDPFWIERLYEIAKLFDRPRMWAKPPLEDYEKKVIDRSS